MKLRNVEVCNKRGGWASLGKIINVEGVKIYLINVEGGNLCINVEGEH